MPHEREPRRGRPARRGPESSEPINPTPLPPEPGEFPLGQDIACVMQGTDQGTAFVIKLPAEEIAGVRGHVPLHLQHELYDYPTDRLIVLWECFPGDRYDSDGPRIDATLLTLWTGFEALLVGRFPEAASVVTTWEDTYEREAWQAFLEERGYRKEAGAAFVKRLPTAGR